MSTSVKGAGEAEARPGAGVMMYTVLEQARADLEGTLARLAAIGYRGIETYGLVEHFGPARVRRAIDAAGLVLTSAHAPFPAGDQAERILDENAELGAEVLVWSMERAEFDSPQAISHGLRRVNEAAERAAARGMRIAYHNHFAEFAQFFDGRQAYDLLLAELDDRVLVELDAYWAVLGGADAAEVVTRLGDRIRFIHVKDGPGVTADRLPTSYYDDVMVPVGEGKIDWVRVLDRAFRPALAHRRAGAAGHGHVRGAGAQLRLPGRPRPVVRLGDAQPAGLLTMEILFLGGAGMIGSAAAAEVVRQGHRLTVVTRGEPRRRIPPEARQLRADVHDAAALRGVLAMKGARGGSGRWAGVGTTTRWSTGSASPRPSSTATPSCSPGSPGSTCSSAPARCSRARCRSFRSPSPRRAASRCSATPATRSPARSS